MAERSVSRGYADRNYGEKTCRICSRIFTAKSSRTVICGDECRRVNGNAINARIRAKNRQPRKACEFNKRTCHNCNLEYTPTSNRQKICTCCDSLRRLKSIHCSRCGCLFKQTNGRNYACLDCRKEIAAEIKKQDGIARYEERKQKIPVFLRGFKIRFCLSCFASFKPMSAPQQYCKLCSKNRLKCNAKTRKSERKHLYEAAEKAWRQRNAPKLRADKNARYKKDPSFRIACCARAVMRQAFDAVYVKKPSFFKTLGIDAVAFVSYLLSHKNNTQGLFTLENYGWFWHVDHVRPIASFDLRDPEQAKKAFHYTNCQPLKRVENLKKSSLWHGIMWTHDKHERNLLTPQST